MTAVNLRPFTRPGLDVLFLALNPPEQSNANAHYFSGGSSRFFALLYASRLITQPIPKSTADDSVFGTTSVNHKGAEFGVIDLVDHLVQTQSSKVRPMRQDVERTIDVIRDLRPRFVCVIHSKVRDALNRRACFTSPLSYGMCGAILPGSDTEFVLNYFPNGNSIPDAPKLEIFKALKNARFDASRHGFSAAGRSHLGPKESVLQNDPCVRLPKRGSCRVGRLTAAQAV